MAPAATKNKLIPIIGPTATDPIPPRRARMPVITIKIAITVTPSGLSFCI